MALVKMLASSLFFVLNTTWVFLLMIPVALVKLLVPVAAVRKVCNLVLNGMANRYNIFNAWWVDCINPIKWRIERPADLSEKDWYLLVCNHQSWVDILVLQSTFNGRVPFLKFFIKYELIYIPMLGFAWWALDFPFMRRRGGASAKKDLEVARQACEKFRHMPTSVINFLEGTRFTLDKQREQKSPYQHLLKPKIGGIGMALETMGDMFTNVLDVTIAYPQGTPSFTDLMAGRMREVVVQIRKLPVPLEALNAEGVLDRHAMQAWTTALWQEKDQQLAQLMQAAEK